jgi:WD40 repeat protein
MPFAAAVTALVLAPLPVLTGTIVMAVLIRVLGKLPFWTVILVIPSCIAAFALQSHFSSNEVSSNQPWMSTPLGHDIVVAQIPFVLGCWVFYRALTKAPAPPERAKLRRRILYMCATLAIAAIVTVTGVSIIVHRNPWHPEVSWAAATGLPKIAFANERQTKIPSGFVSWSPDGTKILTLSIYDGWLTVQDPAGRVEQEKKLPSLPSPFSPYLASNAREIIFSRDVKTDIAFSVVDIASGRTVFQEHSLQSSKPGPDQVALALSPDGTVLMAVHDYIPGRPISLYDTKTWQKLSTIEAPAARSGVERLVFSSDGSRLTFASSDKFFIIDARTGQTVSTLPIKAAAFIALSPDNSMAAVEEIGTDPGDYVPKAIRIFRLSDAAQVASHASLFHGPNCPDNREDCGLASPILWDPAGRFLVFPDGYHTIRIWNPFAGNGEDATIQTRYFEGGIALSPDGGLLAIGNGDFVSVFHIGN